MQLTKSFFDPKLLSKAHFRCSVDGSTEWDLFLNLSSIRNSAMTQQQIQVLGQTPLSG